MNRVATERKSRRVQRQAVVPGLDNVAPALFVALIQAARRADLPRVVSLQEQIDLLGALHAEGHRLPCLKAACAHLGIGSDRPAMPLEPLNPGARARVATLVDRHAAVPV